MMMSVARKVLEKTEQGKANFGQLMSRSKLPFSVTSRE